MDALHAFLRSRITVMAVSADVSITELFFPNGRVRCATGQPAMSARMPIPVSRPQRLSRCILLIQFRRLNVPHPKLRYQRGHRRQKAKSATH